jgi:tetratricopeptide (TPR) repeat protein
MAAFGATPADRAARYLRAARDYLAAGDAARARAAADRAVDSDPYDVDAVDLASGLAFDQGEPDAAAAMLTRLLTARDDRLSAGQADRRAGLSYRLGHARAQRGDLRQAAAAYEIAIAIAADSDGAIHARRALVELARAAPDPGPREAIAHHLQAITAATGALGDLVAWADELRRHGAAAAAPATLELAIACGHPVDFHQRAFLSIHTPYAMRDDEQYRAALDADRALIPDPGELARGGIDLGPLAIALTEAAALVWPDLDDTLARHAASGARRLAATRHAPASAMLSRIAAALGAGAVMLYERDDGPDAEVIAAATPVIVLGPRMLAGATPAGELRAILARAVELTRPEHAAFAGLSEADGARLIASVVRLFGPAALREATAALVDDPDVQRGHGDMVKAALPVRLRGRFEQLLAGVSPAALDLARYRAACERSADRAALLVGGDPVTIAALAAARGDGHGHLIAALAQPGWLPLRTRLGLGVR